MAQRTRRVDDDLRRPRPARGLDAPALALVVPRRRGQLVAEADVRAQVVAVGEVAQVVPDLRLARVRARPGRVGREGERVQVRRDVALAAGVRVGLPGAADARRFEADREAESGEAGPDDRDADVR
jgi:hypothetical protein